MRKHTRQQGEIHESGAGKRLRKTG